MRIWSLRLRLTNSRSIYVTIWLLPGKNVAVAAAAVAACLTMRVVTSATGRSWSCSWPGVGVSFGLQLPLPRGQPTAPHQLHRARPVLICGTQHYAPARGLRRSCRQTWLSYGSLTPSLHPHAVRDATDMNCASADGQTDGVGGGGGAGGVRVMGSSGVGEAALLGKDFVSFCHKLNTFFHGT